MVVQPDMYFEADKIALLYSLVQYPPPPLPILQETSVIYLILLFVLELDKLLAKKTSDPREVQVVEAMEDICQSTYFRTYDHSPPTIVKVCKFLIGELLVTALFQIFVIWPGGVLPIVDYTGRLLPRGHLFAL